MHGCVEVLIGHAAVLACSILPWTSLCCSSKILTQDKEHFARLAVDAVLRLKGSSHLESIHIIKKTGGTLKVCTSCLCQVAPSVLNHVPVLLACWLAFIESGPFFTGNRARHATWCVSAPSVTLRFPLGRLTAAATIQHTKSNSRPACMRCTSSTWCLSMPPAVLFRLLWPAVQLYLGLYALCRVCTVSIQCQVHPTSWRTDKQYVGTGVVSG